MQGWYLGALRAAEEMARHLGNNDFADECRKLFEQAAVDDDHLWTVIITNMKFVPLPTRP
jgi:hypothetical protein